MPERIIKISPNKEKARSIMRMVNVNLERIEATDKKRFVSSIVKDYYDSIRELMSVVLLLDGFKATGEEAHKNLIDFFKKNYSILPEREIFLVDGLRVIRNKISYDGFFVNQDYLNRNLKEINHIINKLKLFIDNRLIKEDDYG